MIREVKDIEIFSGRTNPQIKYRYQLNKGINLDQCETVDNSVPEFSSPDYSFIDHIEVTTLLLLFIKNGF